MDNLKRVKVDHPIYGELREHHGLSRKVSKKRKRNNEDELEEEEEEKE
jgi:hypothetical protein